MRLTCTISSPSWRRAIGDVEERERVERALEPVVAALHSGSICTFVPVKQGNEYLPGCILMADARKPSHAAFLMVGSSGWKIFG